MREIKLRVKPKDARIDKYLASLIKSLSRSKIKKLIKQGHILVDGQKVAPDYELKKGNAITVEIPAPAPAQIRAENIPLKIIYEDPDILVIEKQAGLVIHPTIDHPSGTLVNALLHHLGAITGFGESFRPGIVHRLDKGASGLLAVAKTQKALLSLKEQFKARRVVKKYLALVKGRLEPPVGKIDAPISRHPGNYRKFTVSQDGKEALTTYKVVEVFPPKSKRQTGFTLVEVEPKTGRTHQIRVHLSYIGHPIYGDRLYGGKPFSRIFLHATFLEFTHPQTKERVKFESPLPTDLQKVLEDLKQVG